MHPVAQVTPDARELLVFILVVEVSVFAGQRLHARKLALKACDLRLDHVEAFTGDEIGMGADRTVRKVVEDIRIVLLPHESAAHGSTILPPIKGFHRTQTRGRR